jgi:hypothetical protein
MGWPGGVSSRRRGSLASEWGRARWHRLGGRGGDGHQHGAHRSEGGTGGRLERLDDARTSAAGGRRRVTVSGMLRLPARTRGSGEKCRGARRASPGEESATREREKKGGARWRWGDVLLQGGAVERELGGSAESGATRWEEERGSRWRMERERGGSAVATREQRSQVAADRHCSIEQGSGGHRHVGPRPQYRAAQ